MTEGKNMLDKNTLVIGAENTGKTSYLQSHLKDLEGVFWLALGTPLPEGAVGGSVWNYKQWLAVPKLPNIAKSQVLVLDGLSNLQGLLLAEILMDGKNAGGNPEQKDYGAAAYRLYQGFLLIGAMEKRMHASVMTREKEEGKGDSKTKTTEIQLSPMTSVFILPSFPNAVYLTMKVLAGQAKYGIQENTVLAKQLIAAKVV